jgi:membrane associated rhomboid family serine protease
MIPLRDENPSGSVPVVTRAIIVLNVVAFLYELMLGPELRSFVFEWGLVPERLTLALRFGEESPIVPLATLVTSTFLHGGWLHLIGNMWYLWIFGDNIEDRLGKLRFVVFYLISGIAAGWIHFLSNPASRYPTVGASGAIAAVLGAYAITFPRARVITLIPLFFYFEIVALPAFVMLIVWFAFQFLSGLLSSGFATSTQSSGVAWWAHIGGFLTGAIAMKALGRRKRSRVLVEP